MDGEFVCEEKTGLTKKAVGGGNLLVLGKSHAAVLAACERAVRAIDEVPEVITPFPGGIVRSGSKVGSKYKGQIASTNDAYCPTLKAAVKTELPLDVEAVMEIVIDGLTKEFDRRGDARRPSRRSPRAAPSRASPISPPAITAAISARIISISRRSSSMSALVFELKQTPDQRLDLSPLTPARLKDLKAKEIEALVVGTTRNKLTVGDAFKVKGKDCRDDQLRRHRRPLRQDRRGLTEGEIVVDGDVGAYLGAGMKGGKIEVKGNAGVLAARA